MENVECGVGSEGEGEMHHVLYSWLAATSVVDLEETRPHEP
jgi:hypothetical protein